MEPKKTIITLLFFVFALLDFGFPFSFASIMEFVVCSPYLHRAFLASFPSCHLHTYIYSSMDQFLFIIIHLTLLLICFSLFFE